MGARRGTSEGKLYNELGLENLEKRSWYKKICCFFKIYIYHFTKYLLIIVPISVSTSNTRNTNNISLLKVRQNSIKIPFSFCSFRMEQTGPKYLQFRKFEYL